MYRLIKFPGFKFSKPQLLLSPQVKTKVCSRCGISSVTFNRNLQRGRHWEKKQSLSARDYGTKTNFNFTSELTKRKRFSKDKKYFTYLLEVYDDASVKERKARVRNLKPRDISRIVHNPNVNLDHLHDMKKREVNKKIDLKKVNSEEIIRSNYYGVVEEDGFFKLYDQALYKNTSEVFTEGRYFSTNAKLATSTPRNGVTTDVELQCDLHKENEGKKIQEESGQPLLNFQILPDCDDYSSSSNYPSFNRSTTENIEFSNDVEITTSSNNTVKANPSIEAFEEVKRKVLRKKVQRDKLEREKISALENMCKEKAFNTTLYSYLSLCVSCNLLQRGLSTLHHYIYRSKMSQKSPKVTDIRIFEVLMQAFAAKGNTNKVNELWKMLTSAGLKPSINMFSSRLESTARSHRNEHMVAEIIKGLKDEGFRLNDIFVKCTFLGDQRDVLLKAINAVEPKFEPEVPLPVICYSCSLLQEINGKERNTELRSPAEGLISEAEMEQLIEEQFNNELLFHLKVKSIEKRIESPSFLEINRQRLNEMRESWMADLRNAFKRDVTILETLKRHSSVSLLPYLKVLDQDDYVDIMMKEIQRLAEGSETYSPHTAQLYRYICSQVRNRYVIKYKKTHGIIDKTKMLYNKYCNWYLNPSVGNQRSCNSRQEWQQLLHENQRGPSIVREEEYWPSTVMIMLGKFLYNIIVGDVNIDVNIFNKTTKKHMLPAFYRVYRNQGYKVLEEIKPHPVISKLFRAAGEEDILFDITLVPMVSPPLPWTSYQSGGYLMSKTDFIRLPDQALQQRQRLKEAPSEQLYPSLDSLNQLGSIPWKVNTPVLDTVIEVFNNGGSSKLDIPEPSYLSPVAEPVNSSMTNQERFEAYRQRMLLRRQKAEMYSLWCDALYKLSLANHFRDRIFWLPHNMDFRGRVYPCPPHLNHLGADMSRSLLCFAQGKPLGPSGLDWLKIHLVNLLGSKKRDSIQDRLDFANSILPEIIDSAEKPLTGSKWWMESETPWQTLASCMEIRAALRHPEGPEQFSSHFPVHQDGSCNGLQHYAALGRDEAGACSVNLMPQSLPQDVYTCVANLVERERAKDSAAGVKVAKELDGFVRRKVIKQTVMTTVYGVTRFGARLQIARQLKDIDSFPKEYVWPASTYLVMKTFESLREMFQSTREIQDWFTECARLIAQVRGENTEYVTPLGLPVVQHYSRQAKKPGYSLNKFGTLKEYFSIDMFEKPNVMKQKNAFPPNFIHSLDSSHMMLTSIFSEQKGITFVSVHDCYWTHPSTVQIMNKICREQFVALHSQPILENLSEFMLKKYGYCLSELEDKRQNVSKAKSKLQAILTQVPPKGTFRIENVLDSIYFFS